MSLLLTCVNETQLRLWYCAPWPAPSLAPTAPAWQRLKHQIEVFMAALPDAHAAAAFALLQKARALRHALPAKAPPPLPAAAVGKHLKAQQHAAQRELQAQKQRHVPVAPAPSMCDPEDGC